MSTPDLSSLIRNIPDFPQPGIQFKDITTLIGNGPIALHLGVGLVPIRKPGKLPAETYQIEYELEYGTSKLEIHRDALSPGMRVLLIDDLLATGGTIRAATQIVERAGGKVTELAFVIELTFLGGREKLAPYPVFSLIQF
jgi:adenine phosphoribosyltransferase